MTMISCLMSSYEFNYEIIYMKQIFARAAPRAGPVPMLFLGGSGLIKRGYITLDLPLLPFVTRRDSLSDTVYCTIHRACHAAARRFRG